MPESIEVLFEDNHCIAVFKPAPLLTQAPPGVPSMESLVKAYLKERYHKAGNVYLGVPHRVDRAVTGVVLFARSSKAAQRLAQQFEDRAVAKIYWAAVEGTVTPAEGKWEDWIRKVPNEPRGEAAGRDDVGAQHAVLDYRCLKPCAGGTLLEVKPLTGRMHQIRVQAAARGCPVRGDELYGARLPFGPAIELPRDRIIALHARSLTFLHPIRYEPVTVHAVLPQTWREIGVAPS
jgi:23S rRNA pseudouridine1911/1915/1917 synthase